MEYGYNNQYSTSYGAQGAADGGGFVGGDVQSSPAGGQDGYGKETLRPVTIKQVLEAHLPHSKGEFKIDGQTVSQVTFVGQIRSVSIQTINTTYQVDDGTGIIDVKLWSETEGKQDQMDTDSSDSKLVENAYCRVYGRVKEFGGKRQVVTHMIKPIADYNEINYHLLEATAVHLFFTRGPPQSGEMGGRAQGQKEANNGQQEMGTNGRPLPNMTGGARKIYVTLRDMPMNNEGMHIQMLSSQLNMPTNDVYKGAEELVSLGLIFTTVDDQTWAVLDY